MNHPDQHFSDEILNAYIDGELGLEDDARITAAMEKDDLLRRRVNELKKISELVRASFSDLDPFPLPQPTPTGAAVPYWRAAAVASFLVLGGVLGWHVYDHHVKTGHVASGAIWATVADRPAGGESQVLAAAAPLKVMFHIGRNDIELFNKVLDEADRLLAEQGKPNQPLAIRVVASHGGLSLFESTHEANGDRVRDLKLRYGTQVDFVGCGETLNQMQSRGPKKSPQLFPDVIMVDSGVMELLRRQQQGWTFVFI